MNDARTAFYLSCCAFFGQQDIVTASLTGDTRTTAPAIELVIGGAIATLHSARFSDSIAESV